MSRHQRQRRSRRGSNPLTRIVAAAFLALVCALVGGGIYAVTWVINTANSAPNISQLSPRIQGQLSEVYASNGQLLGYLSTDVLRKALTYGQQPSLLREATVAVEDRRFYQHGGVDYQGMVRAAIDDVFNGSSDTQGGSTLTMQLVKNIYLPQELTESRSLKYKIVQAKLANELADRRSKDWILTQYLNDVFYGTVDGQAAYGVGAASQTFFDTSNLSKLSLAQIALLAGLPQAPTSYNPFLHPRVARERRSEVLAAMVQSGYITAAQQQVADAAPLELRPNAYYRRVRQPYVFDYIRQQLIAKLGQKTVDAGGLKVYTSINLQDQAYAKQALEDNEGYAIDPDAALVSTDPDTGQIVAMAQNTTYGLGHGQTTLNYATNAFRQSGSSFKTFALMTLIHDYDGDPNSTYYVSKELPANWYPPYNYPVHTSEETYQGTINITRATTTSDNTVYAQLAVDLGIPKVLATAYAMGITTHQQPVPSIVIGGLNPGVTTLQMADAYATLASGGLHYSPTIINRVRLRSGRTMSLLDTHPNRVFTDGEAFAGTQVLKTVLTGAGGTGTASYYGCPAAGKTGTTSNYTDAWFVGYTPKLSTAVWVGYTNEAESMSDVNGLGPGFGGTLASPIWKEFMQKASAGYCSDFPTPTDTWSGKAFTGAHSTTYSAPSTYAPTPTGTTTTGTGTGAATGAATGTTPIQTAPATAPAGASPPTTPAAPASGGNGIGN